MHPVYEEIVRRFEDLHTQIAQAIVGLGPEALDWTPGPEMNAISVLVVHTTGAERYLLGDVVARDPSGRVREAEFRPQGLDAAALGERLARSRAYVRGVLETLSVDDLPAARTFPRDGHAVSVAWAVLHALEHTEQHSGHIQLTRQLWDRRTG
jgi:hypothetical protein